MQTFNHLSVSWKQKKLVLTPSIKKQTLLISKKKKKDVFSEKSLCVKSHDYAIKELWLILEKVRNTQKFQRFEGWLIGNYKKSGIDKRNGKSCIEQLLSITKDISSS